METDLNYIQARIRALESRPYLTEGDEGELDELQERLKRYLVGKPPKEKEKEKTTTAPIWNQPRPELHSKKGKKLNKYQIFISECRRGYGGFDGEGKKGFEECVDMWREVGKKK